jgi:hypothetical protein
MLRSTFSTTTIASSTTMPMASTSPNRLSALIEKPSRCSTANVPTMDTGTASSGMIDARHVCRNRMTTSTTSATASSSVCTTDLMDARTNCVGSYAMRYSTPSGMYCFSSSIVARTAAEICSAFDPGAWNTPVPTAGLLSSRERSE